MPIIQPGGNFCLKVGMKRAINPWYKTEGKIALAKLTWRTHTSTKKERYYFLFCPKLYIPSERRWSSEKPFGQIRMGWVLAD